MYFLKNIFNNEHVFVLLKVLLFFFLFSFLIWQRLLVFTDICVLLFNLAIEPRLYF